MTRTQLTLIAAAGSAALLIGAFGFQFFGVAPCKMCLWQRWPHAAAILIGALIYATKLRALAWFGALATLTTAGIAAFHTGVERLWWDGPTSCTGGGNLNLDNLLSTDIAPVVMCDEIAWSLFGLTMANYNMLISLALCALWTISARKP